MISALPSVRHDFAEGVDMRLTFRVVVGKDFAESREGFRRFGCKVERCWKPSQLAQIEREANALSKEIGQS
jgi:hypothetical protein